MKTIQLVFFLLLLQLRCTEAQSKAEFLGLVDLKSSGGLVYKGHSLASAPHELLLDVILELQLANFKQSELITQQSEQLDSLNCTVCFSSPCQNGGICHPLSANEYSCECPDSTTGHDCEIALACNVPSHSCGQNTDCSVSDHAINCVCKKGFSGDAYNVTTGCSVVYRQSCFSSDPHYTSFDGNKFGYQGSCPTIFSQPCTQLSGGYEYFSVRTQNILHKETSNYTVAYASSVEVTMYGQIITIADHNEIFFNNWTVTKPYYWPSIDNPQIIIEDNRVHNDQQVLVTYADDNNPGLPLSRTICVYIPDVPSFQGADTLCGLAGNIDDNCLNDFRLRDGTVMPREGDCAVEVPNDAFGDDWLTSDFWHYDSVVPCIDGHTVTKNMQGCRLDNAAARCQAIYDSIVDIGPLAACSVMGEARIMAWYDSCIDSYCAGEEVAVCAQGLTGFVHDCQTSFPGVNVSGWRTNPVANCPLACVDHASYLDCAPSCTNTCTNQTVDSSCATPCFDGCYCDAGYVRDDSQEAIVCVKIADCNCYDDLGALHPPQTPWLSQECTIQNECCNGVKQVQSTHCSGSGFCNVGNETQTCECDEGYEGDGFKCTDMNECDEPENCRVQEGHGVCHNIPGSYSCECHPYFSGRDCEFYLPNRHCADLFVYHGINVTGIYKVQPCESCKNISVYCDMDAAGGGWTTVSAAETVANFFSGKSLKEYEEGFGLKRDGNSANGTEDLQDIAGFFDDTITKVVVADIDVWLGLRYLNIYTTQTQQSLRIEIFRCAANSSSLDPPLVGGFVNATWTECIYDYFGVLGQEDGWRVNITEQCHGSEMEWSHSVEPWATWDKTKPGPTFFTADHDSQSHCSRINQQTGWWFLEPTCGSANLNGVRLPCDGGLPPSPEIPYISWGGSHISQARMYVRPLAFPNYDVRDS